MVHVVPAHADVVADRPIDDVIQDDEGEVEVGGVGGEGVEADEEVGDAGRSATLTDVVPESAVAAAGESAGGEGLGGALGPVEPGVIAGQLVEPEESRPNMRSSSCSARRSLMRPGR